MHGVAIEGATLYCTHQPCILCAKMLINCGVREIHYVEGYPDELSQAMFAEAGVDAPQGGPAIDGVISLSSPTRTAVLGFVLAAVHRLHRDPLMGRLARRAGAVDHPTEERRMHSLATPLLGGLGIYIAWVVPVLLLVPLTRPIWGLVSGASIIVAVGLFDDLFELEPIIKFTGQLLAIAVALYFGVRVTRIAVPFVDEFLLFPGVLSLLVTVVWMAAVINMVNFIDGLDGLAAGVCGISAVTFSLISISTGFPALGVVAAVLAGATFAFLRFNFHPASIFMGDAGSMLLGFVLATISVQSVMKGTAAVALLLPLLVLGVPFIDLFLIVWRRWRRGVPFYAAGADHVHHDLVLVHGFSQRKSVLVLYTWCLAAQRSRHRHAAGLDVGDRGPGRRRRDRDRLHGQAPESLPLWTRHGRDRRPRPDGGDTPASTARREHEPFGRSGAQGFHHPRVALPRRGGYSLTPHRPGSTGDEGPRSSPSGESVAFLILGGVVTGGGVGAGHRLDHRPVPPLHGHRSVRRVRPGALRGVPRDETAVDRFPGGTGR